MAIRWVDPFIDTLIGGIHGTLNTTTRNGTYEYPFGIEDVVTTSSGSLTSINGTTIASGDEVRFKGQALSSYYYSIGTPDSLLTITNISGTNLGFDSAYTNDINSFRTQLITAYGYNAPAIIIHDAGLQGTDGWMPGYLDDNFQGETGNSMYMYGGDYNPLSGWAFAKNGYSGSNLKIAFIDPQYYWDCYSTYTSSNTYWYNFPQGVTITDGWDSSTTRNGVTVMTVANSSNNLGRRYLFANWGSSSKNTCVFDMPNTHVINYNANGYFIGNTFNMNLYSYYGTTDSKFKFGSYVDSNSSSWDYVYTYYSRNDGNDYSIHFKNWYTSRYTFWVYGSGSNGQYGYPKSKFDNVMVGRSIYFNGFTNNTIEIGNIFVYTQYSGSALFYGSSGSNANMTFTGHLYGHSNMPNLYANMSSVVTTFGQNSTNPYSNNTEYPNTNNNNAGPSTGGEVAPSQYLYSDDSIIKMAPVDWYENKSIMALSREHYDYGFHQINATYGTLDTSGLNYKNTDVNIKIVNKSYQNSSYFGGQNIHFSSNTYDGKPLGLATQDTTAINSSFDSLLCYNDTSDDELTIQCSATSQGNYYTRSFIIPVSGTYSSGGILTFSSNVTTSSAFYSINPQFTLFPFRISGNSGTQINPAIGGGTTNITYSTTFSAADLNPEMKYIGVKLRVYNFGDYQNKYVLKNMSASWS